MFETHFYESHWNSSFYDLQTGSYVDIWLEGRFLSGDFYPTMFVGFALLAVATAHVHHHHHHRHKSGSADADSGAMMGGQASFEDQREQEESSHKPVTRRVGRKAEKEVRRVEEEEAAPIDTPPEQVDEEAPAEENDDGAEPGAAQESYMDENEAMNMNEADEESAAMFVLTPS